MSNLLVKTAILVILLQIVNSCEPPDCDRLDCGTCGNACCTLEFHTRNDPATMNTLMTSLLKQKGPDQHYTFVGSNDLRPYNISAYFILQGIHTTLVKQYNDTLNFVIYPVNSSQYYQSRVRAFSISQIQGAFCDDGQNYKNLVQLMKGTDYVESTLSGCPQKIP